MLSKLRGLSRRHTLNGGKFLRKRIAVAALSLASLAMPSFAGVIYDNGADTGGNAWFLAPAGGNINDPNEQIFDS